MWTRLVSLIAKVFHVCQKGNLWSSFHSLRGQAPRPAAAEISLGDADLDANQSGIVLIGDHYVEEQSTTMLKFNGATSCCVVYGSGAGQVTWARIIKNCSNLATCVFNYLFVVSCIWRSNLATYMISYLS